MRCFFMVATAGLAVYTASASSVEIYSACPSGDSKCGKTLAEAAKQPCAAPCTLQFRGGEPATGPQSAVGLKGTAEQPLRIVGGGQTISGAGIFENATANGRPYDALLSLRGAEHVVVSDLTLVDALACNGSNLVIDPLGDWFGADRGLCGSSLAIWDGLRVRVENVRASRYELPLRCTALLCVAALLRCCVAALLRCCL